MSAKAKILGNRYGRLIVISEAEPAITSGGRSIRTCLCQCDCGSKKVFRVQNLRSGISESCGCIFREYVTAPRVHGHGGRKNKTREYNAWCGMKHRCTNPNDTEFRNYGGRGIAICERWISSYINFYTDMGPCPDGYTIERKDVNGNYEPSNCVWADSATQSVNRRNNKRITSGGRTLTYSQWEKELMLPEGTISHRIKMLGWEPERTFCPLMR